MWQSMETAPKDVPVVVLTEGNQSVARDLRQDAQEKYLELCDALLRRAGKALGSDYDHAGLTNEVVGLVRGIVDAEREACAKIADARMRQCLDHEDAAEAVAMVAVKIRARNNSSQ